MAASLAIEAGDYRRLLAHMYAGEDEQVAFLFTHPPQAREPLRIAELYPVPTGGFADKSPLYLALSDEVRGQVIGRTSRLGGCLVEAHSHAFGPAGFSPTDLSGFEEWVPHVRWRLKGRPYVALVFAEGSFDALVWEGEDERPALLASLLVEGEGPLVPTGIGYRGLQRGGR